MTEPPDNTVILYKGHSDYESLNTMVDHWAQALARRGFRPEIIDLRAPDAVGRVVGLIRGGTVRLFLSVNGFGVPAAGAGPGFYQETDAPLAIYFVDHPLYHYPTLRTPVKQATASFATPHHVDVCRSLIRDDLPVRHLAHAAAPATTATADWPDRDIPLLVSGSLAQHPETARAGWAGYGAPVRTRLEDILAGHRLTPRRPLHEIVLEVLGADPPPLHELFSYFSVVDSYLRSQVRLAFMVAANALPVTVCGRGWDAVIPAGSAVRPWGAQPTATVLGMMARTRLVVNLLPPYYESHERPFQAMAHGAVAATVAAPWFLEAVGAEAVLALPTEAEAAVATIAEALTADTASAGAGSGSGSELAGRAAHGHAAWRHGHRWDHRLEQWLGRLEARASGADDFTAKPVRAPA
jgi:hypothetical protein